MPGLPPVRTDDYAAYEADRRRREAEAKGWGADKHAELAGQDFEDTRQRAPTTVAQPPPEAPAPDLAEPAPEPAPQPGFDAAAARARIASLEEESAAYQRGTIGGSAGSAVAAAEPRPGSPPAPGGEADSPPTPSWAEAARSRVAELEKQANAPPPPAPPRAAPAPRGGRTATTVDLGEGKEAGRAYDEGGNLARVYRDALDVGLDDEGAKVAVAIARTEGGMGGARGDVAKGGSRGTFQLFFGGGMGNEFAKALGVSEAEADRILSSDPHAANTWALKGYLGNAIRAGQAKGLHGADLATYAQRVGQRSVSPERAGANYDPAYAAQEYASGGRPASEFEGAPQQPVPNRRDEFRARANDLLGTPYVWGGKDKQGLDCSAFISNVWGVNRQTTDTLSSVADPISKDDLQPGDALNLTTGQDPQGYGHVRMFDGWADPQHKTMWVYESSDVTNGVARRVIPYDAAYTPMRLKGLGSEGPVAVAEQVHATAPPQEAEQVPSGRPTTSPIQPDDDFARTAAQSRVEGDRPPSEFEPPSQVAPQSVQTYRRPTAPSTVVSEAPSFEPSPAPAPPSDPWHKVGQAIGDAITQAIGGVSALGRPLAQGYGQMGANLAAAAAPPSLTDVVTGQAEDRGLSGLAGRAVRGAAQSVRGVQQNPLGTLGRLGGMAGTGLGMSQQALLQAARGNDAGVAAVTDPRRFLEEPTALSPDRASEFSGERPPSEFEGPESRPRFQPDSWRTFLAEHGMQQGPVREALGEVLDQTVDFNNFTPMGIESRGLTAARAALEAARRAGAPAAVRAAETAVRREVAKRVVAEGVAQGLFGGAGSEVAQEATRALGGGETAQTWAGIAGSFGGGAIGGGRGADALQSLAGGVRRGAEGLGNRMIETGALQPQMGAVAPGFFSQLRRTVETKVANRATPQQVSAAVRNAGVKPEEIEWTGLDTYLRQAQDDGRQVTKEDILRYLDEHQVQVEEVLRGPPPKNPNGTTAEQAAVARGRLNQLSAAYHPDPTANTQRAFHVRSALSEAENGNPNAAAWHLEQIGATPERAADDAAEMTRLHATIREAPDRVRPEMNLIPLNNDGTYFGATHPRTHNPFELQSLEDHQGPYWQGSRGGEIIAEESERAEAEAALRRAWDEDTDAADYQANQEAVRGAATSYGQYTLEGGQNYRELLLTLPVKTTETDKVVLRQNERGTWEVIERGSLAGKPHETLVKGPYTSRASAEIARENYIKQYWPELESKNTKPYRSGHWDETNILAHVRFNDRVDADGKKVLHIEEIQSDWHQEGRRKGYQGRPGSPEEIKKAEDASKEALREMVASEADLHEVGERVMGPGWRSLGGPERYQVVPGLNNPELTRALERRTAAGTAYRDAQDALQRVQGGGQRAVDEARAAYQRSVDEASEAMNALRNAGGSQEPGNEALRDRANAAIIRRHEAHDRMERLVRAGVRGVPDAPFKKTWPELAAKRMLRWAAENGYDRVSWTTGSQQNKRYSLTNVADHLVWNEEDGILMGYKEGARVFERQFQPSELPQYVGEDVARRLREQPKISTGRHGTPIQELLGDQLEVGQGGGMVGFYDKMLPEVFGKLGKRYGARVESTDIARRPVTEFTPAERSDGTWTLVNNDTHLSSGRFDTEEEAAHAAERIRAAAPTDQPGTIVHSMDVTPDMRKAVTTEGQPLFVVDPQARRGATDSELVEQGASALAGAGAMQVGTDENTPWQERVTRGVLGAEAGLRTHRLVRGVPRAPGEGIVPPGYARYQPGGTRLPEDPEFARAAENTPGVQITPRGVRIELARFQKEAQQGQPSGRTGVYYMPEGSDEVQYEAYRRRSDTDPGAFFGGTQPIEGETLLRRPLVIQTGNGGDSAIKVIKQFGRQGAHSDVISDTHVLGQALDRNASPEQLTEGVRAVLVNHGVSEEKAPAVAEALVAGAKNGMQLEVATTEAIAAHLAREAGYDSIVSFRNNRVGEVFDLRESHYPGPAGEFRVHPEFEMPGMGGAEHPVPSIRTEGGPASPRTPRITTMPGEPERRVQLERRAAAVAGTPEQQAALRPEQEGYFGNVKGDKFVRATARRLVADAIDDTGGAAGQRRGVMSDSDVARRAAEVQFGTPVEQWLNTKPGRAFNAEEATALGYALDYHTRAYDVMEKRFLAAQAAGQNTPQMEEELAQKALELSILAGVRSGAAAEAGRALRAFRQILMAPVVGAGRATVPSRGLLPTGQTGGGPTAATLATSLKPGTTGTGRPGGGVQQAVSATQAAAVRGGLTHQQKADLIGEAMKRMGGGASFQDWMQRFNRIGLDLAAGKLTPQQAAAARHRTLSELVQPSVWEKIDTWRYASMLSNWHTHITNAVSNLNETLSRPLETFVAGLTPTATGAAYRSAAARDVGAMFNALPEAWTMAKEAFREGVTQRGIGEATKLEGIRPRAFGDGTFGRAVSLPLDLLTASDEFFRHLNTSGALHSRAMRLAKGDVNEYARLIANPTEELVKLASKDAAHAVFQNDPGPALRGLLKARNARSPGGVALGFILPFVRTPANIFQRGGAMALRGTVLPGMAEVGYHLYKGNTDAARIAAARTGLASAFMAYVAYQTVQGNVSGAGPTNPSARQALEAQGWQPNSVKIGGRWVDYTNMGPAAVPIALVANAWEGVKEGQRPGRDLANDVVRRMSSTILDVSYLRGLSDFVRGMETGGIVKALEQTGTSVAGSAVPAGGLVSAAERVSSPGVSARDNPLEAIAGRIPGLNQLVPEQVNVYGRTREQGRETEPMGYLANLLLPRSQRERTDDPVLTEVARLARGNSGIDLSKGFDRSAVSVNPPLPTGVRKFGEKYAGETQTGDTARSIQTEMGRAAHTYISNIISSDAYQSATDQQKAASLQKAVNVAYQITDRRLGEDVKRDPHHAALLAWQSVPQFEGVKGSVEEIREKNFRISKAKALLAEYSDKYGSPENGKSHLWKDNKEAYKLAQTPRLDPRYLKVKKDRIDKLHNGALSELEKQAIPGAGRALEDDVDLAAD